MERDDALLPFDDDVDAALDAWRAGEFDDFDATIPPVDEEPESDVPSDLDEPAVGEASSLACVPPGAGARGANPQGDASPTAAPDLPDEDRPLDPKLEAWIRGKDPATGPASPESIDGAAAAIAHARARSAAGPVESLFAGDLAPGVADPDLPRSPEAPQSHGASSPPYLPPGDGAPEAPWVAPDPPIEAPGPPDAPPPPSSPGGGASQALYPGEPGVASVLDDPPPFHPAPPARPVPDAVFRARSVDGSTRADGQGEPPVAGSAEPDTGSPPAEPLRPAAPAPHRDDALLVAMTPQLGLELGVAHDREPAVRLTDLFVVPPFSTLDSRADYWAKRKRAWLSLGIQSEVGRTASPYHGNGTDGSGVPSPASVLGRKDGLTLQSDTVRDPTFYVKKRKAEAAAGRELSLDEFRADWYVPPDTPAASISNTGTSVFDPVLCEVAYRWFSPAGGLVLDPFAGGSVRGIVASVLGRRYVGVELRPEQVHANRVNAGEIVGPEAAWDFGGATPMPTWVEGSATDLRALVPRAPGGGLGGPLPPGSLPRDGADLIFTCSPYGPLEKYSDDPRDLSNVPYATFRPMLASAIAQSAELLRPDRFAVYVVGECRDEKTGRNYGIVHDTVRAALDAGLGLWNEAILETAIASAAVRATKQHLNSRKLVRVHQHVLVFVKGDGRRAAQACGDPQLGGST